MPPVAHAIRSRRRSLVCAAIVVATGIATQQARAAPAKTDALRVQRVEIIDRKGFEKPMVAATIMVPAG